MGFWGKGTGEPRDPDAALHDLQRHFQRAAERYERAYKRRAFLRAFSKRSVPWLLAIVAMGEAYLALDLYSPWPPLLTIRHVVAYRNCDTARLMGLAPARRGEPGYWEKLDRDKDGIACEPVPAWKTR
jgi:hypothetical protein